MLVKGKCIVVQISWVAVYLLLNILTIPGSIVTVFCNCMSQYIAP